MLDEKVMDKKIGELLDSSNHDFIVESLTKAQEDTTL